MYQYTEEQILSMKKVEATRASRFGAEIRRMTADEKDEVLPSTPIISRPPMRNSKRAPTRAAKYCTNSRLCWKAAPGCWGRRSI